MLQGSKIEQVPADLCFDLVGEALLRRRARGPKNASIGKEAGKEREKLCVGAEETTVDVVLIKAQPDAHAELLGWDQAGDMCGWGMLHRAASADATGDTEAC